MALFSCQSQNFNNDLNDATMLTNNTLNLSELKSVARKPSAIEYRDLTGKVANGTAYFHRQSLPEKDGHVAIYGDDDGFEKIVVDKSLHFMEVYSFNEEGTLLSKGLMYPEGFKKGTWLYYTAMGTVEKEIDYDKPFGFSWENVLAYLNERAIQKESIVHILRDAESNPKTWTIEWNIDTENAEVVTLNGDSGKVIEKIKQPIRKEI